MMMEIIFHFFSIDGYVCWVHSINDGVVVSESNVTLEFEGTGRGADDDGLQHECVLKGPQKEFIENCKAPICVLSQSILCTKHSILVLSFTWCVLTQA